MSAPEDPVGLAGRLAARWAKRIVDRLKRERGDIDALNVFPVPDGDTGSNMYHTVRSAYRAVERISGPATLDEVVEAMANGALRGARGNSGLILAVALRGVADGLEGVTVLEPPVFADALGLAAARARDAIADPVDGTMLTVLEAMAEEARETAAAGADILEQITAVRERSREALRETTGQLAVLSDAGVVDAGSTGIVELFDLLYLTVTGAQVPEHGLAFDGASPGSPAEGTAVEAAGPERSPIAQGSPIPQGSATAPGAGKAEAPRGGDPHRAAADHHHGTGEDGLELVLHLSEAKDRTRTVKRVLAKARGTSVVVAWPMVHVHVGGEPEARVVLDGLEKYGIADLRIEDLSESGGTDALTQPVALGRGTGYLFTCARLGAHAVDVGRTAWEDVLAEIVDEAEAPVVVLPESDRTAHAVRARHGEAVSVLPEDGFSPVAVLAALAVYDPEAEPAAACEDLAEAAAEVRVAVVAPAERAAAGPLMFTRGELLARVSGTVRPAGTDPVAAVAHLLDGLLEDGGELVTLVTGRAFPGGLEDAIREAVARDHAAVRLEFVPSGDPHGFLVLGVE